jgi:hypothetical protein
MMNEMAWTAKRQELVLQKAEIVGEQKALDGVAKEYEKFCSQKAAEVAGAGKETPVDDALPF